MATQGALVKASDLSAYLTADTVMDALDIEALKEALGLLNPTSSNGGAQLVSSISKSASSSTDGTTALTFNIPTSDFDFIEILSYNNVDDRPPTAITDQPFCTFIHKSSPSGVIPIRYEYGYCGSGSQSTWSYHFKIYNTSYSLSGNTLTLTIPKGYNAGTSYSSSYSYRVFLTANVYKYK